MKETMKELNMDELEQANGGIIGAAVAFTFACGYLAIAVTKLATDIYKDRKNS